MLGIALVLLSYQEPVLPGSQTPESTLHQRASAARAAGRSEDYREEIQAFRADDDVDLEILVSESDAIVDATVGERFKFSLAEDGQRIYSVGSLHVHKWLKGAPRPRVLRFVRPGGVVKFADGIVAQQTVRGPFRLPAPGKRYILFLARDARGWNMLYGPQGAFEISYETSAVGDIRPADLREDATVASTFRDQPSTKLLQAIEQILTPAPVSKPADAKQ